MSISPTPLERLLLLEKEIQRIQSAAMVGTQVCEDGELPSSSRSIWHGDELLLLRLLRNSPIALLAYHASADLTTSERSGLNLTSSRTSSYFLFCELLCGDAVVWVEPNAPEWIWKTPTVMRLFHLSPGLMASSSCFLQTLPLFKPVVRSQKWTLVRQGEITAKTNPSREQTSQANQLRRLETLERKVIQLSSQHKLEFADLHQELTVLNDLINRLLRLKENEC